MPHKKRLKHSCEVTSAKQDSIIAWKMMVVFTCAIFYDFDITFNIYAGCPQRLIIKMVPGYAIGIQCIADKNDRVASH